MYSLIGILSAILYLVAIVTIIPSIMRDHSSDKSQLQIKIALLSAKGALFFHGWQLILLIFNIDMQYGAGQNLSILNIVAIVSFIIVLLMTFSIKQNRLWPLLPIIYSFAALIIAASTLLPATFIRHLENDLSLFIHISIAIFSYSILMIAALYSLQLFWLSYQLKTKKLLSINANLPPLLMIERQLFKIIACGNLLLLLTLITGFNYIDNMFATGNTHKAILSFFAFIVFSLLLYGYYYKGWRGKRITWLTVFGAFLLTLGYFGSRLIQEIILVVY